MRAKILVRGAVQGVGYRFFAIRKAGEYKISGYARNLENGDVEVLAEGDKGMVADFIAELRVGPEASRVTGVDVQWFDQPAEYDSFVIEY